MNARATFSESGPVFSSSFSEFWNKKKLTHSRGRWSLVVSLRWSISKRRHVLENSAAAWCVTPLENAFRLVFEAFFLARRFAKIDYSWCVFFSLLSPFFPISQKLLNFEDTRAKAKDEEEKDQQQKSSSHALIKHNDSDKNNENARSSALPYLVVCTKKSCFKFMCTFSERNTLSPVLWH